MAGLSPVLLNEIHEVLLACDCMQSHTDLKNLFTDRRLNGWQHGVPETNSSRGRVNATINYLIDKQNSDGENALALFMRVLSEQPGLTQRYRQRLLELAEQIQSNLFQLALNSVIQEALNIVTPNQGWQVLTNASIRDWKLNQFLKQKYNRFELDVHKMTESLSDKQSQDGTPALVLLLRVLNRYIDKDEHPVTHNHLLDCIQRLKYVPDKEFESGREMLEDYLEERKDTGIMPPTDAYVVPERNSRFLELSEREWLARNLGNLSRFQDPGGRRNFLIAAGVPDTWIGEINLYAGGAIEMARTVLNDLELRGRLPHRPHQHALGALLEASLVSFGLDIAIHVVAIIFRYGLIEDPERLSELSERYAVPLSLVEENEYQIERTLPTPTLPIQLPPKALKRKLEALYHNGRENWLDVRFLENGARAARSVCRLEWRNRGQGTGFLVADDLLLTNYHVLIPPDDADPENPDIDALLPQYKVRFGAVTTASGGVSPGHRVVKIKEIVSSSPLDKLDYVLLRLRKPVTDGNRILRASCADYPVYEEQCANIIQHPLGGAMKVALRNNQVVAIRPHRIYYLSDTQEGSSGSPVFDDDWQVIALHRAGGLQDETGRTILEANEGVPILDILEEINPYLN